MEFLPEQDGNYLEERISRVLECECECDGEATTISEYLFRLLAKLWEEKECFSGKRPFGNSGWECDIYIALVRGKFVSGKIDDSGCLDDIDQKTADELIKDAIGYAFRVS